MRTPLSFLPLTPAVFHILLALTEQERHGYAIAREVRERTANAVRFGPGTLYGTLGRMLEAGLVAEAAGGAEPRRRYYQITPLGRAVARAEAARLEQLVGLARSKALLKPESQ